MFACTYLPPHNDFNIAASPSSLSLVCSKYITCLRWHQCGIGLNVCPAPCDKDLYDVSFFPNSKFKKVAAVQKCSRKCGQEPWQAGLGLARCKELRRRGSGPQRSHCSGAGVELKSSCKCQNFT